MDPLQVLKDSVVKAIDDAYSLGVVKGQEGNSPSILELENSLAADIDALKVKLQSLIALSGGAPVPPAA